MSGYIGTQPVPQATQTRDSFTATSGQTSFATGGYTPNFLDVYLTGVKLASADYTATNGSDVVLASGAATGDILEVVAYTTFEISGVAGLTPSIDDNGNATAMTIDSSENVLIGKTSAGSATGVELAASGQVAVTRNGAVPAFFRRNTSDGSLIDFNKDGTTVGSIGVNSGDLVIHSTTASHVGLIFGNTRIEPSSSTGSISDGTVDLGNTNPRFKDLYLSGGVYLGGTGSANKLDDVETGTWTPQYDANTITWNYQSQFGAYVKVGKLVHIQFYLNASVASGTSSFNTKIINLPFTSANLSSLHQSGMSVWFSGSIDPQPLVDNSQTTISLWKKGAVALATAADVSSHYLVGSGTYYSS